MRPIHSKITLLLATISLTLSTPAQGEARSRKPHKTTQSKKSSSKSKHASKNSRESSRHRHHSYSIRSRARAHHYAAQAPSEEQLEKMRQDSIRLRTGGTAPMHQVSEKSAQTPELLTTRFRHADSTLTRADIRELYFSVDGRDDTAPFLNKIETEADRLIENRKFAEALKTVQQGLWRTPTHIGLIKRACDLSLHLKSSKFNAYMYQLVELLSMIAHTGDGSSFDKAVQVRSLSDALLFEQHWNETPREEILSHREQANKGKGYIVVEIQGKEKGKTELHYYLLQTTLPITAKK